MNGSSLYDIRQPGTSGGNYFGNISNFPITLSLGLSVLLRVYPDEYLPWTVMSGFMVFVHDLEEAVVSDSPRINSRSGSATNLIISKVFQNCSTYLSQYNSLVTLHTIRRKIRNVCERNFGSQILLFSWKVYDRRELNKSI